MNYIPSRKSKNNRSSLISAYYASELIPNYKDVISSTVNSIELTESPDEDNNNNNYDKENEIDSTQIDNTIKKKYNFIIPAIVIELNPESQIDLVKDDIEKFFSSFGEIKFIDLPKNSKKLYLLYKFYFSALFAFDTVKEILSIRSEDEKKKETIKVKILRNETENDIKVNKDNTITINNETTESNNSNKESNAKLAENKITPTKLNLDCSHSYLPKKLLNFNNNTNCNYSSYVNETPSISEYYKNANILPHKNQENTFNQSDKNENTKSLNDNNNNTSPTKIKMNPQHDIDYHTLIQQQNYMNMLINYHHTVYSYLNNPILNKHYYPQKNEIQFNTFSSRDYTYKYVCNYDVQIENDEEFNVAKRIIGQNGAILKKIIFDNCIRFHDYSTKVRLRGKGSGYKEGSDNIESEEPLQLCISSLNYYTYIACCRSIEQLLLSIYYDYFSYTQSKELSIKCPDKIKKYDFVLNHFVD